MSDAKLYSVVGVAVLSIICLGEFLDYKDKLLTPTTVVETPFVDSQCLLTPEDRVHYLGNGSLDNTGLHRGNEIYKSYNGKYHNILEVVIEAEDPEYWEIEQIDGKYYRVRREDREPGYYGKYEFDTEEYIGDVEDLYNYAKVHKICDL